MHEILLRLRDEILFPVCRGNLAVRADQLRARLQLYPTMMAGQALLVVLFIWLMWGAVAPDHLLLWGAVAYVLYAADMLGWLLYRHRLDTERDCTRWHIAFTLFTAAGGLVWGSTALWLFPPDSEHQALLIMVILGLSAASVTTNPAYPSSFYIYALSVVLPLIFRFVVNGSPGHWPMTGILCLYLVVVLKAGGELGESFRIALRRRHENIELVEQLTEQKALAERSRQEAEAANREKSRFLAAASHDLRQPLQALTLFSEALSDQAKDGGVRHVAGQIEKSVHALTHMFNELLDVSRLDAGVLVPRWQDFELQPLLDRLYVDFAPLAHAKGLGFEIPTVAGQTDGAHNGVVHSDPFLLERVLRNLISNAIRYTDAGGVQLRCGHFSDGLKIEVADSGIGIHPDVVAHIFEEYYQADNPHRDRRKGLGLGLAIVRRIERLLGYRVGVHSEPGKGSVFGFTVALGDPSQLVHPFVINQSTHDLTDVVVALVEDDPDIRTVIAEQMEKWGCRVFAGELPDEAVSKAHQAGRCPDLVVCDYRLPQGKTATDVIKQMRAIWGPDIPALVLTGDTAPEVLQDIQASGAILLNKPVAPARLRSQMHLALHGKTPA